MNGRLSQSCYTKSHPDSKRSAPKADCPQVYPPLSPRMSCSHIARSFPHLGIGRTGSLASRRAVSRDSLGLARRSSNRRMALVTMARVIGRHVGGRWAGHRCEDDLRATRARLALAVDAHGLGDLRRAARIDCDCAVPLVAAVRRHVRGFAMWMRRTIRWRTTRARN